MCGKAFQPGGPHQTWTEYNQVMSLVGTDGGAPEEPVTPMRFARIVRLNTDGARENVAMRWGFSALSAQTPSKPDHIHARAETIDTKPTFRDAFRQRRGIWVTTAFNEAEEVGSRTVQYVIRARDGKPFSIAVLWEAWQHPERGELLTYVMATVPANTLISKITDRMPAVLAPEDWAKWLGEEPATPEELKALLRTVEGDWEMTPEKKTPPPKKPSAQDELF